MAGREEKNEEDSERVTKDEKEKEKMKKRGKQGRRMSLDRYTPHTVFGIVTPPILLVTW